MSIASTLKRLSPPLYRLRIFVIIVALLALPFAIYYFLYVRSQTAYFTDRSFRKLSLISSQITLKVESAGSVLKNTSDKFIRPRFVDADSPPFNSDPARKQKVYVYSLENADVQQVEQVLHDLFQTTTTTSQRSTQQQNSDALTQRQTSAAQQTTTQNSFNIGTGGSGAPRGGQ